ncbi:MAG TPA: polysaccharide ABC transporter ATP-binding protein, partial [Chitinophagaceae bacterium]|nr:polysaccharide ABC transporter ATP-binding protein [Chitinophagaceae bacterium]
MKAAIEIRNLGKQYRLAAAEPYIALRDIISGTVKNMFRSRQKQDDTFWALRDINLDIQPGERVGIIGRNGAGKSTLLKIISRIIPPTTGEATIRGRVGSLLEVGTGFHPELTGRENIYLNGSILGLKKAEINRQMDAIIDFSGVSKFIDTPLKNYSSGMQMRLAFAVASHLESEILLIDEVLAVGDLEFQQKCVQKMEELSIGEGRTVVFVSHNLDSIRNFCNNCILLHEGKVSLRGETESVIKQYVSSNLNTLAEKKWDKGLVSQKNEVCLRKIWVHKESGEVCARFDTTERIGISAEYEVREDHLKFSHGLNIYNQEQVNVFDSHDIKDMLSAVKKDKGLYRVTVWIPG